MAGKDFGGRMTVRLSSGTLLSLRGTFNVEAARMSVEGTTNQDGSSDRIMTPVSPGAEIAFRDDGSDHAALMEAPRQNIVVNEENTGVTHHFIEAYFSGKPQNNRSNGEITGISIVADTYRKTGA